MSILGNFQVLSRQPNVFAVSQNIEKCEKLNSLSADTLIPKKTSIITFMFPKQQKTRKQHGRLALV